MSTTALRARTIVRAALSTLAVSATAATLHAAPAAAAQSDRCPGSLDAPSAATTDTATDAVVCLINAERTSRGMRGLHRDGDLGQAARGHASDMVRRTYFSHVTPGGADLGDRIRHAGYANGQGWKAGEALGWGTGSRATPAALVDEWLASPPHRHIILDPSYRELGVGVAPGAPRATSSGLAGATYAVDVGVVR
jgi:uncharacterized protein YkwD